MASSPDTVGGHDCEFVEAPPDDLFCLICTFVARDPQQLTCCGRIYCKACLEGLKDGPCPHCREAHWQSFPDMRGLRGIMALLVLCPKSGDGCEWTGELRNRDHHTSTVCEYQLVHCVNGCTDLAGDTTQIPRRNNQLHLTQECPYRTVQCEHCGERGRHQEITGAHLRECPEVLVKCEREGCEEMIRRFELTKGMHREQCLYETVSCKYADYGCTAKLTRKHMLEHENDTKLHLDLTLAVIRSLQTTLDSMCATIQALKVREAMTFYTVEKMDARLIRIQAALYTLKAYSNIPEVVTIVQISELGSLLLSTKRPHSITTFKMVDFSRYKESNTKFSTPPFYTTSKGYKMCVRISTNDTHIGVCLLLMRGENDDYLTWPFQPAVIKIELLNQTKNSGHHSHIVSYDKDSDPEAMKRVANGELATTGLGRRKFLQLCKLTSSYLVNDTLYFRVSVLEVPPHKHWLVCTV